MRCSEILGLRGEYVFDTYIYLCAQYDEYGYRDTKTKDKHNIPLASRMIDDLWELAALNGRGFIFSADGGATPVNHRVVYKGLLAALHRMGMPPEEIKERGLCVHAWLFNVVIATSMLQYRATKSGGKRSKGTGGYRA